MKPARSKQLRRGGAKSRSGQLTQDPVEVSCRVRPLVSGYNSCLRVISPTCVQFTPNDVSNGMRNGCGLSKELQYTFRSVFDEGSSQGDVFESVALPLVRQLIAGKNGLLFTYGVTGSGKTYTMTGEPRNPGIMPRCLEVIFNTISSAQARKFMFRPDKMNGFEILDEEEAEAAARNELQGLIQPKTPKTPRRREAEGEMFFCRDSDSYEGVSLDEDNKYSCFVTYVEIYNKCVFDLLEEEEESIMRQKLTNKVIREDPNKNMYVHGATEVEVKSPEEALEVFSRGQRRRKVAQTMLNEESSRSHAVFNIRLVQAPLDELEDDGHLMRKLMTISQLSLVDLAGSERTSRTNNTGQRLREAGSINNSLMTLRSCLEILRENQQTGACKMVPYRDSKLTTLFKNYFDGEGAVRMVVCVNPRTDDCDETAQVLKFAELTQEVQVPRPTPQRVDVGMTPGRRRAQLFAPREEDVMTPLAAPRLPSMHLLNQPWPSLVMGPNDHDTPANLQLFLIQRQAHLLTANQEYNKMKDELRPAIMHMETELVTSKQDNLGLRGLLELERKKNQSNEDKLAIEASEKYSMMQKLNERDHLIRQLQGQLDARDLKIGQQGLEKQKVKEKCQATIQERDKKNKLEMKLKVNALKEQLEEDNRIKDAKLRHIKETLEDMPNLARPKKGNYPQTPKSVNSAGTLFQPSGGSRTPGPGPSSRMAVCNPRRRRSRSAGEKWLDHRAAQPVDLGTVFQPNMRKRKSITKLTDLKDLTNPKITNYGLTTQEHDSDGLLQTVMYKGDVIPTCSGGTQVIFNDVETLKQSSPTSVTVRKRSVPDENTENRCRIGIEGHSKRPRS